MVVALVIWLLFGIISASVASGKGQSGCLGFALGVLFGPIGLIIVLVMGSNVPSSVRNADVIQGPSRVCPYCQSYIPVSASVCRFCQREVNAPSYSMQTPNALPTCNHEWKSTIAPDSSSGFQ